MNRLIQKFKFSSKKHYPIVVIGGGTAGLNFTSQMIFHKNVLPNDIVVINPQIMHSYQPGWTMVGGGIYDIKKTLKPNNEVFPKNVNIIRESCVRIDGDNNTVITDSGQEIVYQQLVVVPGIRLDWEQIIGAKEALDDDNSDVASIYWYKYAVKMNKIAKNFKGGKAIFTEPQMPIKCAGAPQKIVYLSNDRWKKQNIQFEIEYNCAKNCIFGVTKYAQILENFAKQQGIELAFKSKLIEIKKDDKMAVFQNLETQEKIEKKYDLLHIVPPQKSFSFIKESGLADPNGFVDVDMGTLQHKIYKNIWSMGDASSLPTSKTAAAIMSQSPILISNLMNQWKEQNKPPQIYEGYTSCPIFTSQSQLLLAEFKYDGILDETFGGPLQKIPNHLMFQLKKSFFPFAYWHLMSKGIWGGRDGLKIFQI